MSKKDKPKKEKKETYFSNFIEAYKTNIAFKSLVKLIGYFIFIIILMILIAIVNFNKRADESADPTQPENNITYKEILESVYKDNYQYKMNAIINENIYSIDVQSKDNVITGYLENVNGIYRFKIQDGAVYEINLNQEIKNNNLFSEIDLDFIITPNLIEILLNNQSIKQIDEETIYTYNISKSGITYQIKSYVNNNVLNKIEISNDNTEITINYS